MNTPNATSSLRLAVLWIATALLFGCQSQSPTEAAAAPEQAAPAPSTEKLQTGEAPSNASEADRALASAIESALAAETALHGSTIGVSTSDGVVTLTGSARSSELRSMAAQVALSVDGVKLVRNELAVARDT